MPEEVLPPVEDNEPSGMKQLRDALARRDSRIKDLEGTVTVLQGSALEGVVNRAGYDPTNGVVKLVMEKYTASGLTPEALAPEKFTEFAKQHSVEPTPAAPTAPTTPLTPAPLAPQPGTPGIPGLQTQDPAALAAQQQMAQLQQPGQQLLQAAQSVAPPNPADIRQQIATAEAAAMRGEGSWDQVFALKNQTIPQMSDGFGAQQGFTQAPGQALPTHTQ